MRDYSHITLPYHIPSMWMGMAMERFRPFMSELPGDLVLKIQAATTNGEGLSITEDDLNSLSDDLWAKISAQLGV